MAYLVSAACMARRTALRICWECERWCWVHSRPVRPCPAARTRVTARQTVKHIVQSTCILQYSHPWPTQPFIPPGSVNEYQLRGKAKAGTVHSVSGWTRGVKAKLWDPLRTRAIPERLRGVITRRYTNPRLPLPLPVPLQRCSMGQETSRFFLVQGGHKK